MTFTNEQLRQYEAEALGAFGGTDNSSVQFGDGLLLALENARASRFLIAEAQVPLRELYDQAGSDIEREARAYQIDLVENQLTRAADIAEKRLQYFSHIRTESHVKAELALCAHDQKHWFEYYAWGIDPRPDAPLSLMPFGLFPFQERFVEWLDYITFNKRVSGVVEKARDMGATETVLRWMLRNWLFREGFQGLILSANEDLVDSKKDPSTLFEKLRFQMRMLPAWMAPPGFDLQKDMPYMLLSHPTNGSTLQGDAPTPNVGRQRRATFVLGDEFAAWQHGGYPQYTALSRTTNTFCAVSSVQGKFNKFGDLAHDGHTAKFEMDWREHLWRDERWYNSLKFGFVGAAMTDEEIAQEVDRNFAASQPGLVLKNVREEYCFITWDEFVAGFARQNVPVSDFYDRSNRPIIPTSWNWGRVTDYGESAKTENDTHIWAYSLFTRPQQAYPFHDSLFFFYSLPIMPIGATELEAFSFYSDLEQSLGVRAGKTFTRSPTVNDMSHEATDAKDVLLNKCGDNWHIPDLDFDKGRRKLIFHFEIIDKHMLNPFRPVLMGRCRIHFVALPNIDGTSEYFLAKNERSGSYFVTPSTSQRGFKRLRAEIGAWHYPPEERGKPVPKMRPASKFDDIITTVRYAVARWGVDAAPLTHNQKVVAQMPVAVQPQTIAQIEDPARKLQAMNAARVVRQRIEANLSKPQIRNPLAKMRFEINKDE